MYGGYWAEAQFQTILLHWAPLAVVLVVVVRIWTKENFTQTFVYFFLSAFRNLKLLTAIFVNTISLIKLLLTNLSCYNNCTFDYFILIRHLRIFLNILDFWNFGIFYNIRLHKSDFTNFSTVKQLIDSFIDLTRRFIFLNCW